MGPAVAHPTSRPLARGSNKRPGAGEKVSRKTDRNIHTHRHTNKDIYYKLQASVNEFCISKLKPNETKEK